MNQLTTSQQTLADWLARQPDSAPLYWGQPHLVTGDVHTGWIDVTLTNPDAPGNWTWEVVAPDETDTGDLTIRLEPDKVLYRAYNSTIYDWVTDEEGNELYATADRGHSPSPEALAPLEARCAHDEHTTLVEQPGWSSAAVSAALAAWCEQTLGICKHVFVHDPEFDPYKASGLTDELNAKVRQLDVGELTATEIAPGIKVADDVFDMLLTMPMDEAAKLTEAITRTLKPPNN